MVCRHHERMTGAIVSLWRNRIIGSGEESPEHLLANPLNFRRHPKHQQDALLAALQEVGWVQDIIVNRTTGHLIDGHLRVELALRHNEPTIPVCYVELSPDEERLILATFDPLGALAFTDKRTLEDLMREVSTGSAELQRVLDELARSVGIQNGTDDNGITDKDDIPKDSTEAITNHGDLWILGPHRLLCGDSTNAGDVDRLLDGNRPNLTITDPPYGVEYDAKWRDELSTSKRRTGKVTNDERSDWRQAWVLSPSNVIYSWCASWYLGITQTALEESGFDCRSLIIWAKKRFVISRGHYHWQHEPCWYAVRNNASANWIGDRSQTTVWTVDIDENVDGGHSTQKPVECMERPIRHHSGDVYDPFVGSGTTIIAAQRQQRKCYAMELNPDYVDIAVRRWERFTGETAFRLDGR